MEYLLEPFNYAYMANALIVCSIVGGMCAFLSCYLMLRGWSLIGDALSHSIVPGVAGAYILGLPFSIGAFLSGGIAALSMLFISEKSELKTDAVIGIIFTGFFGLGLFIISLNPISVSIQSLIMGNILAVSPADLIQLLIICAVNVIILLLKWRDFLLVFFDEKHASAIGLRPTLLKTIFFILLSASVVAAMQTVGAFLVIALVVTPGAIAYLLCDRFSQILLVSVVIGSVTCFLGAYLSYFLNGATGGLIVILQTFLFLAVFMFGPKHGYIWSRVIRKGDTPGL